MECLVLGCDGSYPSANGACSGYLLKSGKHSVLLDLGSGVLGRLMAVKDPAALDAVVITHWHADHASDLLTLRYYLLLHQASLRVYAPVPPDSWASLCEGPELLFEDLSRGLSLEGLRIGVAQAAHPVPAFLLRAQGEGKTLVYTGDTNDFPGLADFFRGADAVLCDASFTDAQWQPELPHLSASLAARRAAQAGAGRLVLTHFPAGNDPNTLLAEAQAVFPGAEAAFPGMRLRL